MVTIFVFDKEKWELFVRPHNNDVWVEAGHEVELLSVVDPNNHKIHLNKITKANDLRDFAGHWPWLSK